MGERVEAALCAIDDGKTDIDSGFYELGGDEDDGMSFFPQAFGFGEDGHDVARAHAGGEVERGGVRGKFLVEGLGCLGGVEDEETAGGGVVLDVLDKVFIVQGTEVMAGDALKCVREISGVGYDFGDFCGWNTDVELFAAVECGLGSGAKNCG